MAHAADKRFMTRAQHTPIGGFRAKIHHHKPILPKIPFQPLAENENYEQRKMESMRSRFLSTVKLGSEISVWDGNPLNSEEKSTKRIRLNIGPNRKGEFVYTNQPIRKISKSEREKAKAENIAKRSDFIDSCLSKYNQENLSF